MLIPNLVLYNYFNWTLGLNGIQQDVQFFYTLLFTLNDFTQNLYFVFSILGFFVYKNLTLLVFLFNYNLATLSEVSLQLSSDLLLGYYALHPICLYFSLVLILINTTKKKIAVYILLKRIYLLAILAFMLGAYWSLGNSAWGFLWVNDVIEFILLIFIIIILFCIHKLFFWKNFYVYAFLFCCALIGITLLRFGLIFSRHSFFNLNLLSNQFFFLFTSFNLHCLIYYIFIKLNWYSLSLFFFLTAWEYSIPLINIVRKKVFFFHLIIMSQIFLWLKFVFLNLTVQIIYKNTTMLFFSLIGGDFQTSTLLYISRNYNEIFINKLYHLFSTKFFGIFTNIIAPYVYSIIFCIIVFFIF